MSKDQPEKPAPPETPELSASEAAPKQAGGPAPEPETPAPPKLAAEAEALCADLERFFRRALGDMPKAVEVGEIRAQQAAWRDLVQRASSSSAESDKQLATVKRERDQLKDAGTRARADFLNYQARTAKDLGRAEELALRGYMLDLLPVLDSLDLAEKDATGPQADPKRIQEALHMIATGLRQALNVRGLERLEVAGKPFDPTLHETAATRPADTAKGEKPNTVAEELRAGYMWKGLVLRPAQVLITEQEKK